VAVYKPYRSGDKADVGKVFINHIVGLGDEKSKQ